MSSSARAHPYGCWAITGGTMPLKVAADGKGLAGHAGAIVLRKGR
jgi:hypothetical protein